MPIPTLFVFFAVLGLPQNAPKPHAGSDRAVVIVPVQGEIDIVPVALVQRALRVARSERASTVILEIDTPGGRIDKMWQIARPLAQEKEIETVAFVDRKAISAGAFVAVACKKIYMAPSASIGAATPVQMDPLGQILPVSEDPDVRGKMYAALRGDFRALAESRGRNPVLAEAMVDPQIVLQRAEVDGEVKILEAREIDELMQRGQKVAVIDTIKGKGEPLSLSAQDAQRYGFIDGVAENRDALLKFLSLDRARPIEVKPTWSEDFVSFLNGVAPVLLILGFVLAFVEMKIPGFGLAGILSVVCFLLLFFGNYLAGLAEIFHILMFVLGLGLIVVELFVLPGTIVFGAVGFLCVVYGLVASFLGFYWPQHQLDFEMLKQTGTMFAWTMIVILVSVFVLAWLISKYLHAIPFLGKRLVMPVPQGSFQGGAAPITAMAAERFLGQVGRAATDLRPAGKIDVDGVVLDAQSNGPFLDKGTRVRVVEVSTNRIVVAKEGAT